MMTCFNLQTTRKTYAQMTRRKPQIRRCAQLLWTFLEVACGDGRRRTVNDVQRDVGERPGPFDIRNLNFLWTETRAAVPGASRNTSPQVFSRFWVSSQVLLLVCAQFEPN
jgi:hypothetical protein